MAIDPDRLYDICEAMRTAVILAYADDLDAVPLPDRTFTSWSAAAVADDCEQFVVAPERVQGYEQALIVQTFQEKRAAAAHAMRVGTFSLMLTRCMESSKGTTSKATEEDADARMILGDAGRMLNGLIVAEKAGELAGCSGVAFLEWLAPAVDGEYATGTLRVAVSLMRA